MTAPRLSALMNSNYRAEGYDSLRSKSLGPQETVLIDLAVVLRKKKSSDPAEIRKRILAALEAGITDDEIQSVYDAELRAGLKDKKSRRLTVIADTLQDYRGYRLPESRLLKVNDHTTMVRDTGGDGIPMILLHALSMDGSMYRGTYPKLAQQGRVIMYDIRGFGTAENAPKTIDMDQLAGDLAALMDRLQIARADIYGTSYGGGIAQVFALKFPQRARSIAILGSVTQGFPILYERATNAEKFGMEYMVPSTIRRWFLEDSIASNTWEVRYARACVRRAKVSNWASAWRTMAEYNVTSQLSQLKIPVLAVGGAQDVSTPPALVKQVAGQVTTGKYIEINPGSHMMVLEQAEELSRILAQFRADVGSADA